MNIKAILLCGLLIFALQGCKPKAAADEDAVPGKTPVTITTISTGLMSDSLALNAVSSFLKKSSLRSSAVGYVRQVNIKIGDYVTAGQVLFSIQTKEASVFKSKALDSLLNFNGRFEIKAANAGVITQVDKLADDYVADGEQLCIIAEKNSLVFLMNVPYELTSYVHLNANCIIELPDHTTVRGSIGQRLSAVDAQSQTVGYIVTPQNETGLPENLVAKIRIPKAVKPGSMVLPKQAVLTNETEDQFWVMKLVNDTTAIKVSVTKGIETGSSVAILTPKFSTADKILLTGQYGLADTALVEIINTKGHE